MSRALYTSPIPPDPAGLRIDVWTERVARCQLHSRLLILERRFDPQVPDETVEIVRMHAQQLRGFGIAAAGLAERGDHGVPLGSQHAGMQAGVLYRRRTSCR